MKSAPKPSSPGSPDDPASRAKALLGGIFDPIHRGHLRIAAQALAHLPVDEVVFLPAGHPPHKSTSEVCNPQHRLEMLKIATIGERQYKVDARELARDGPSYTVLTLRELAVECPRTRWFLLLGADNARQIGDWYQAPEIFSLATPVLFPRPGQEASFRADELPFLSPAQLAELNELVVPMDPVEISSSSLRKALRENRDVSEWVPRGVADYIRKHGLYRD